MRSTSLPLIFVLLCSAPAWAQDNDANSPHHMVNADGSADTAKCPVCHNDDMSLARTKLETCTLCHSATLHAGAAQHLAASPASVAQRTQGKTPELPLDENGKIFCGTCHVFHDPALSNEAVQARRWLPPSAGLSQVVRDALSTRWQQSARAREQAEPGASFSTRGTTRTRLSVEDGALCRHCHGYGK